MTTLTAYADSARIDHFFAAVIGFCANFCRGARQGGYPSVPPTALTAPHR
jgi:hypothetical protein